MKVFYFAAAAAVSVALAGPALANNSCQNYKQRGHGPLSVRLAVDNQTSKTTLNVSWFKYEPDNKADYTEKVKPRSEKHNGFNSGKGKKITSYVTVEEADATCQATTKNTTTDNGNFYEASCDVGDDAFVATCDRTFKAGGNFYYWLITYTFRDAPDDPNAPK